MIELLKEQSFSSALDALKNGKRITREGWNGRNMWLRYYDPYADKEFPITEHEPCEGTPLPWIGMKTADRKFVPWLASQTDLLSNDWIIINDGNGHLKHNAIPVPENIKFLSWSNMYGIISSTGRLALFGTDGLPALSRIEPWISKAHYVGGHLIPCKRSDLNPGDIAFRGITGAPPDLQEFTIHHQYCVILNEDESAYWYNEMDMKVDGICGGVFWYKVIFE